MLINLSNQRNYIPLCGHTKYPHKRGYWYWLSRHTVEFSSCRRASNRLSRAFFAALS